MIIALLILIVLVLFFGIAAIRNVFAVLLGLGLTITIVCIAFAALSQ